MYCILWQTQLSYFKKDMINFSLNGSKKKIVVVAILVVAFFLIPLISYELIISPDLDNSLIQTKKKQVLGASTYLKEITPTKDNSNDIKNLPDFADLNNAKFDLLGGEIAVNSQELKLFILIMSIGVEGFIMALLFFLFPPKD